MTYTHISHETATVARKMHLVRGCYQERLLCGYEAWSGATLTGNARKYSTHYRTSRENFVARLTAAGFAITEQIGAHGRREKTIVSRMTGR